MKAILLPYIVDQNEPSKPLKMVIDLPTSLSKRDALLRKLFKEHVYDAVRRNSEIKIYNRRDQFDFGDVIVEGPNDTFLFVTLIREIPESDRPTLFHATGASWTKHRVFDQLSSRPKSLKFKAEQIPDDVIQEWVDREQELKDQFLNEEQYVRAADEANRTLITKTKRAILEN